MARTRSMSRKHNHEEEEASSSSAKSCPPWSELDHDLVYIVMMKLGVIEFLSFRGVCKSWRSLACENQNKFMASKPPMHMIVSCRGFEKTCHLVDSEGTRLKTILPHTAVARCVGLTCGYLIFFTRKTRDFWLVNPITRKELHFPAFPMVDYDHRSYGARAILVFSPTTSELVFLVSYDNKIWYSGVGKGTWNVGPHSFEISDLCAFKGKIYVLLYGRDIPYRLCELRLSPQPKLTLLEMKRPDSYVKKLASSGDKLYAIYWDSIDPINLLEVDIVERKWVVPCDKTMEDYAFFNSDLNWDVVAVNRESWADPRSALYDADGETTFFTTKMWWYFPHQCMTVDLIHD